MKLIHKTVGLCNTCYRHVPANIYEQDDLIKMSKLCPDHGIMESIVETDKEFYYGLTHYEDNKDFTHVLLEASDRCQLECPHCYHLPDNKTTDIPISQLVQQIDKLPRTCIPMLAGAEATLRSDFVELCSEINKLDFDAFSVLTNGLRFYSEDFTKECYNAGLKRLSLGLNHHSYQGQKVHEKQLTAIRNILDTGYFIEYIGYTIESYDHLNDILQEIKTINHSNINHYRIRCGSFIGRSSDQVRGYLSVLVNKVKEILGPEVKSYKGDDNPYHVMLIWKDIKLRLIQWPDVTNIDLEELATGPWCQFYDDAVITNFVHQVIMRDAIKNNNLPKLDVVPTRYQYRDYSTEIGYWKENFTEPVEVLELDYTYVDETTTPGKVKKVIQLKHE